MRTSQPLLDAVRGGLIGLWPDAAARRGNRLLRIPTAKLRTLGPVSQGGAMSLTAVRNAFALQEGDQAGESDHGC